MSSIDITLIANAGVYIGYGHHTFLVDAIHHEKDHPFSPVRQETISEMVQGRGVFRDTDYILHTHGHSDHFSGDYMKAYLRHNRVEAVFLPEDCRPVEESLQEQWKPWTAETLLLSGDMGETRNYRIAEDVSIQAFRTHHMGKAYRKVEHFCFILHLGEAKVLITGDAEYEEAVFKKALRGTAVDIALVNPLFFHSPTGRSILSETILPRVTLIYHIPFERDDVHRLRRMTETDLRKHGQMNCRLIPLTTEGQRVRIRRADLAGGNRKGREDRCGI